MKRIFALLMVLSMLLQTAVLAADSDVLYKLELDEMTTGALKEGGRNLSAKGTATVMEDENGEKYVAVVDKDESTEAGFQTELELNGTVTVSFDYRMRNGDTTGNGAFYVLTEGGKTLIAMTLGSAPTYYSHSANHNVNASLATNKWESLTFIINPSAGTFKMYQNGLEASEDIGFRDDNKYSKIARFYLWGNTKTPTAFDFRNFEIKQGEIIPKPTDEMKKMIVNPDRNLTPYANTSELLDETLKGSVAMHIGDSVARVNNSYVRIYPDDVYAAPYINAEGSTLVPVRFVTEAIGCEVEVLSLSSFNIKKDGTVIQFNTGDKNAIINGQSVTMPSAPVIKRDRLYVPLRFSAETFGKNVFWDDRGLIVISDGTPVKAGDEKIIKPLLSQIRNYTTIFGNRKYSDVNMTSRAYRAEGHAGGQWGTLDATKRFMATVDRWVYTSQGDKLNSMVDQGLLIQATLNANARNDDGAAEDIALLKKVTTYFLDGTPYTRADGANGTTWGCINNPEFRDNLKARAKRTIDSGIFLWQFDDWQINQNLRLGGCFCDYCMTEFTKYLKAHVSSERLAQVGITTLDNFNYKAWLKEVKGITSQNQYSTSKVNADDYHALYDEFNIFRVREYHRELVAYMEECNGSDIFYSINTFNAIRCFNNNNLSFIDDVIDGTMGETFSDGLMPGSIYSMGRLTDAIDKESVISPAPKDYTTTQLMYSAIPMGYATGQHLLVPWDDWLFGSVRYYANLEELGHTYELPREYPHLFDNYEMPQKIGYLYDSNANANYISEGLNHLSKGLPAKYILSKDGKEPYGVKLEDLKGLQAVVAATDISKIPQNELDIIKNNGMPLIDDEASRKALEEQLWISKIVSDHNDVYSVLRQNQVYEDAPVVLHAVNYDLTQVRENVQIEVNNIYLPAGDTFTVNVYKPGENPTTMKVVKGSSTTVFTVDALDRWAVMEICGAGTVRRGSFNIDGHSGIGLGTRISHDKAYGPADNFTIVTYSEGINSTTYADKTGTQDEAAFVYNRLGKGTYREHFVASGFGKTDAPHGVMIRDGIYSNARFIALMYDSANSLRLVHRDITNKAVLSESLGNTEYPFMKLQRQDGKYIALVSEDGKNYTEIGSYDIDFDEPAAGVFAYSPNGSRAECNVKDFTVNKGNYPADDFETFEISYPGNSIGTYDKGKKINTVISTSSAENLTINDVDVTFRSSNTNVAIVYNDGRIVPVSPGTTEITATARMGMRSISDKIKLTVNDVDPVMLSEDFSSGTIPKYMKTSNKAEIKDDALRVYTDTDGVDSNVDFSFNQLPTNAVFEFDFRAKFGSAPTTGARVIYGNTNGGFSLTADKNGFQWFYGGVQTVVKPIEENKWYHIKVEIDYDKQSGNVFIDDENIVDIGAIRSAIAQDGIIKLGGWRLNKDTYYEWDNLNFYIKE